MNENQRPRYFYLKKVISSLTLLAFFMLQNVYLYATGVVADGTTGTIVSVTSNDTPLVNIAAPNKEGLSHNKYSDFNVDDKNLVINNSKEMSGQSKLGDYVAGNANLINADREADIILNEVTSNRNSNLAGYIEVYGKKADFILANPNGIAVAGAGFINTSKATLVTGTPQITDGRINGFAISEAGQINITGREVEGMENFGLDLQTVDYASIVSRVINISGKIFANELNILSGNDQYDYQNNTVTSKTSKQGLEKPAEFAIDSALLGGMYAGRIKIVATEDGFGVRTRGDLLASLDDVNIYADGRVEYAKADAANKVNVEAKGDIINSEYTNAGSDISLKGDNVESSYLLSGANIGINASGDINYGIAEAGKDVMINCLGSVVNSDYTPVS